MRDVPVPLGSEHQQLLTILFTSLGGFIAQMATLHDLVRISEASVEPLDAGRFDEQIAKATEGSLADLDSELRVRVASAGAKWVQSMSTLPLEDFGIAFGIPHAAPAASAAVDESQRAFAQLIEAYPDVQHAAKFVLGFLDALTGISYANVVDESIVVAAVSTLHTELRSIFTTIGHTSAPQDPEHQLTARVERLVGAGYPAWRNWLLEQVSCDLDEVVAERAAMEEVFQRRNLFVHHGGLVSRRYANAVPNAPRLHARLTADATYARRAIALLLEFGVRAGIRVWGTYQPETRDSAHLLGTFLAQKYLVPVQQWPPLLAIGGWLMSEPGPEESRSLARLLAALAASQLQQPERVEALLRDWMPTGADFNLARLSLLGSYGAAFALAAELLASGMITRYDLETWPTLSGLRDDSRWPSLFSGA